jgi:hypothetical protein
VTDNAFHVVPTQFPCKLASSWVFSGFRRGVNEACALLGVYAAYITG